MRLRTPWRPDAIHDDALFLEPLDEPPSVVAASTDPNRQAADSWRWPEGEQREPRLLSRRRALAGAVAALTVVGVLIVFLAGALRATRTLTTTITSPATTSRVVVPAAHATARNRDGRRMIKPVRRAPKPRATPHHAPLPAVQAVPRVVTPIRGRPRARAQAAHATGSVAREFSPAQAEFSFEDGAGR